MTTKGTSLNRGTPGATGPLVPRDWFRTGS
jgi:hypothetical protein